MRTRLSAVAAVVATLLVLPATAASATGVATSEPKARAQGDRSTSHVANAPAAGSVPSTTRACDDPEPGELTCFAYRRTDVKGLKGLTPLNTVPAGYGPADLQDAYTLPADGGAGQTIAIVDAYDDPSAEADLAVYRAQYGLPPCTTENGCFRKVSQRGGTDDLPAPDSGWAQEISLDLDMVSAAAPLAHILLVEADQPQTDDLGAGVNEAVALGAKYVSNSYGSSYTAEAGSGEEPGDLDAASRYFDHPGVVLTASSGDSAYGVTFPASSPHVTAVGGTALTPDDGLPRGWTESAWGREGSGAGSGCSTQQPKPAVQADTGCAHRTVADVSAVADPETGVAVYDSYQVSGWQVFGGTSASAPIIASVYADAGTPAPGLYANEYPYQDTADLNDVTTGANGTCDPSYLCSATVGYDGPTGLGTPAGLQAFRSGPHGTVSGTVASSAGGATVAGATVRLGRYTATTDERGHYSLTAAPGDYDLVVSDFGFATRTRTGVEITDGGTIDVDVSLDPVPSSEVRGAVTDGSGHGYPLYARITVDGMKGALYTDPFTGRYSVNLPRGTDYTLHVTPQAEGYRAVERRISVPEAGAVADIPVPVDPSSCSAAGYAIHRQGDTVPFDAAAAPDGWTVTDARGHGGWEFDNPAHRDNMTGGTGNFAVADGLYAGAVSMDTSLVSPVEDMTGYQAPYVEFDSDYTGIFTASSADVDLSLDGGQTWTTEWHNTVSAIGHFKLALPDAAGKADVQVRFRYVADREGGKWWELDNVFVGDAGCRPTTGALLFGRVTDANTGAGVAGAQVKAGTAAATSVVSGEDPALPGGFYSMFVPAIGEQGLTASRADYADAGHSIGLTQDAAVRSDFSLDAGRLAVSATGISRSVDWKGKTSAPLTITNTGTAPASAEVTERGGILTPLDAGSTTPLQKVRGSFTPYAVPLGSQAGDSAAPHAVGEPWSSIADYPEPVQDSMVDLVDGTVYSIGGLGESSVLNSVYAYDTTSGSWSFASSAPVGRYAAAHGAIGGRIYVAGGWQVGGGVDAGVDIYDPATNHWSKGADEPRPLAGSASAVVDGKLYVVGGCDDTCTQRRVDVYDPTSDTWSAAPDYPEDVAWEACGSVDGVLYCAGGVQSSGSTDAYSFDPAQHTWTRIANLPVDLWGSSYTASNGRLVVSGGITDHSNARTNAGYAYDPEGNTWSPVPNAPNAVYRSGSTRGLYQVGGGLGGLNPPVTWAAVLPGYSDTDTTAVGWLDESIHHVTLAPGATTTIDVSLDASQLDQPATYRASVALVSDTPYGVAPVPVSMTVAAPATWGKLTGTVTGWDGNNRTALAGATVEIGGALGEWTVTTDGHGQYTQWLDERNGDLQVIAARDGYRPVTLETSVVGSRTRALDITLSRSGSPRATSTLTASVGRTAYPRAATLQLTVAGAGGIAPTGQVSATSNGTTLGTARLDALGHATITLSGLGVGTHPVQLAYTGDSRLMPSASTARVAVTKAIGALTVRAPRTIRKSKRAAVVVVVHAPGTSPTGRVRIVQGSRVLAAAHLRGGRTRVVLPHLATGRHNLRVVYLGSTKVTRAVAKIRLVCR